MESDAVSKFGATGPGAAPSASDVSAVKDMLYTMVFVSPKKLDAACGVLKALRREICRVASAGGDGSRGFEHVLAGWTEGAIPVTRSA